MNVQGPDLSEGGEVDDMLFEDLGSDPPSAEFEGSNERGNAARGRWDCCAPTLKSRLVPKGDVLEED